MLLLRKKVRVGILFFLLFCRIGEREEEKETLPFSWYLLYDGGASSYLIQEIEKAHSYIRCVFSSLEDKELISYFQEKRKSLYIEIALLESSFRDLNATSFYDRVFLRNTSGRLGENFCIIDGEILFLSFQGFSSYKKPDIVLIFSLYNHPFLEKFIQELNFFSLDLWGRRKSLLGYPSSYQIRDAYWNIFTSPKEKPFLYLKEKIQTAKERIYVYSSFLKDLFSLLKERASSLDLKVLLDAPSLFYRQGGEDILGEIPSSFSSLYYLYTPYFFPGLQLFFIDDTVFLYQGPIRGEMDQIDDGILLSTSYPPLVRTLESFFQDLLSQGVLWEENPSFFSSGIYISEIMWMGSYKGIERKDDDEMIEIYNQGDTWVNLSSWKIGGCISGGNYTFPRGIKIPPKDFLVVRSKEDSAFFSHVIDANLKVLNSSSKCLLINPLGDVVDQAGDGVHPFSDKEGFFYSSWGINIGSPFFERRSMERIFLGDSPCTPGNSSFCWQSNAFHKEENVFLSSFYRRGTYATPGRKSSSWNVYQGERIFLNEVHWAGSENSSLSGDVDSADDFIEIINREDFPVKIGGYQIACVVDPSSAGSSSSDVLIGIPLGEILGPGEILVIRNKEKAFSSLPSRAYTLPASLSGTITQCRLLDGSSLNHPWRNPSSSSFFYLRGKEIDIAGDGVTSFSSNATHLGKRVNNVERRSMERVNYGNGSLLTNWCTNSDSSSYEVLYPWNLFTFASPGSPNRSTSCP